MPPYRNKRKRAGSAYRPYKRPAYGAKTASKAQAFGIELKYFDTSLGGTSVPAPGDSSAGEFDPVTLLALNAVKQGDTEQDRDGRKITMKSIHVNGIILYAPQINQTAADNIGEVFIALVQDTQTNGAQLNSEDVYTNPSADPILAACPFRNLQFTKRFKVLKTKTIRMPQPTVAFDGTNIEQGAQDVPFKFNVNLNDLQTTFSGTASLVSNIVDNSLHLVAFANRTELAPAIAYNARLRFVG